MGYIKSQISDQGFIIQKQAYNRVNKFFILLSKSRMCISYGLNET